MRLAPYLAPGRIIANLAAATKEDFLSEAAAAAGRQGLDEGQVLAVLRRREGMGSTALGNGIAIPHAKLPGLDAMVVIAARSETGIEFDAPDGKPCRLFFVVLAPESGAGMHLGLLGYLARLVTSDFMDRVLEADAQELAALLMSV